ncbi:MAG: hypothetical protein KDD51_13730, partial [Bdellovibrionales bacterium]|nr:hypothetical protein [Bdellovibrionales bacterium]
STETGARFIYEIGYVSNESHRLILRDSERVELLRHFKGSLDDLLKVAHATAISDATVHADEHVARYGMDSLPHDQVVATQLQKSLVNFFRMWAHTFDALSRPRKCALSKDQRAIFAGVFTQIRSARNYEWFCSKKGEWLLRYLQNRSLPVDILLFCWRAIAGG